MELVEGNLKEQFGRVLSAQFGSSRSGSSENLLIWSTEDLNSDDSSQQRSHSETGHFRQLSASDPNLAPSTSAQRSSPRVRRHPRRLPDSKNLNSHEVASYSRSLSFSSGSHSGLNQPQGRQEWQQPGVSSRDGNPPNREEVLNMEDYIELDMCSRSVAHSGRESSESEGSWTEAEYNRVPYGPSHAYTLQPSTSSHPTLQFSRFFNTLPIVHSSGARPSSVFSSGSHRPLHSPLRERPLPHTESHTKPLNNYYNTSLHGAVVNPTNTVVESGMIPTTSNNSRLSCFHQNEKPNRSTPSPSVSSNNTNVFHPIHAAVHSSSSLNTRTGNIANSCCSEGQYPNNGDRTTVPRKATESAALNLVQTGDLAVGGSLTCTVVNILKVLRLLDRCGLEDLCTSLYGLRKVEPFVCGSGDSGPRGNRKSKQPEDSDTSVTRSSSFTSAALISPKHSTLPRDKYRGDSSCSNISHPVGSRRRTAGCMVNYILTCSRRGSSLVPVDSSVQLSSTSDLCFTGSPRLAENVTASLNGTDWRRGCSDNLVALLSTSGSGPKHSRTTISRLLASRFVPGLDGWRAIWPRIGRLCARTSKPSTNRCKELADWLSAWIHHGAAIVLAQLANPSSPSSRLPSDRIPPGSGDSVSELIWRHRLLYGITQNGDILITNPLEAVSIAYILGELSRQPTIRLEKRQLLQLWSHHLHNHTDSVNSGTTSCDTTGTYSFCSGDFSLLACQADPRWNHFNVLGQVLQTLRGVENRQLQSTLSTSSPSSATMNPSYLEHSCLSPTITIPSLQSPGFSLFVARSNWELVHALCDPSCN